MKAILTHLFEHKTLTRNEAREVLHNIAKGQYNNSQIASFLTVFVMRPITVEELTGFRDALLELCRPVDLSAFDPIDLCGTGGDNKNTFNISTLSSFVTAGAGVKVAKHGNYGVSSACGSSNVLKHLGVPFSAEEADLQQQLEEAGICFWHAPLFHPAMKNVAPVRKELRIKTFFNMLGPMVNPARPKQQIVGVFNLELARLYNYLYQQSDKRYFILHSLDVYDEISLTGPFKVISRQQEEVVEPEAIGCATVTPEAISGGDTIEEAAGIFMNLLKGRGTPEQQEVVIVNSAYAIRCAHPELSLADAKAAARESLESGKALQSLERLSALKAN